jgi:hypothetical protein
MEYETFDNVAASWPRFIEEVYNAPALGYKIHSSLKRNTPGRWQFERPHTCPLRGIHSVGPKLAGLPRHVRARIELLAERESASISGMTRLAL